MEQNNETTETPNSETLKVIVRVRPRLRTEFLKEASVFCNHDVKFFLFPIIS